MSASNRIKKAKIRLLEERLRKLKQTGSCREQESIRRERILKSRKKDREYPSSTSCRERDTDSSDASTSSCSSSRGSSPVRPSKYRRIISSDEESSASDEENPTEIRSSALDGDVLSLLGPNLGDPKNNGPEIHRDLADRWTAILTQGISLEERNLLISEYPIPDNCMKLTPPKLNDVITTALTESATRRDIRLALLQSQVGAAVTALGLVISDLLKQKEGGGE